jgi:hypothetical protein
MGNIWHCSLVACKLLPDLSYPLAENGFAKISLIPTDECPWKVITVQCTTWTKQIGTEHAALCVVSQSMPATAMLRFLAGFVAKAANQDSRLRRRDGY